MKKIFSLILASLLILYAQVTFAATRTVYLNFQAYIHGVGWQKSVGNGKIVGTVGQAKSIEALLINLMDGTTNMIQYNAHVQDVGWQGWKNSGSVAGVNGKRMEAVRIKLIGQYAKVLDIYYRAHVQNGGWLGWAANGEPAGTAGAALRLEALQIQVVPKGTKINRGGQAFFEKARAPLPTI